MDIVLQILGIIFLIVIIFLIFCWGVFVTEKLNDLEMRLNEQNDINKSFKLKKHKKNVNIFT